MTQSRATDRGNYIEQTKKLHMVEFRPVCRRRAGGGRDGKGDCFGRSARKPKTDTVSEGIFGLGFASSAAFQLAI